MAASNTCLDVPASNSQFLGDKIRTFKNTNIGFTAYKGNSQTNLVIKNVQKMSLSKIAKSRNS